MSKQETATKKPEKIEGEKIRIKLKTGRTATMREITVDMQREATALAATRVKEGNTVVLGMEAQHELLKMCIVRVNDKVLTGIEKEEISKTLNMVEYNQCVMAIEKMAGKIEEPEIEFI